MLEGYNEIKGMISKEKLEKAAAIVTIVGFPVIVASMVFAFYQLSDLRKVASSQNNIALTAEFFDPTNTGVIDAIENNQPILVEHKGKYTDAQLDNYLGDFETIDSVYGEGLLTEDEMCISFSYYVGATSKNQEIKTYIAGQPRGSGFFAGLAELSAIVAKSTDQNCH